MIAFTEQKTGIFLLVQLPFRPQLLLPAIGYATGLWQGRRKAGL